MILIAFDPIYFRPGSPDVQAKLGGTIREAELRRLFPEDTWLPRETYLMTVYAASPEDLERASAKVREEAS